MIFDTVSSLVKEKKSAKVLSVATAAGAAAAMALLVAADWGHPRAGAMSMAVAGASRTAVEVSALPPPSLDMAERFYKEKLAAPKEDLPAQF